MKAATGRKVFIDHSANGRALSVNVLCYIRGARDITGILTLGIGQ